ncbi:MAG: hypothetical protein ACFUZC_04560 [Chthoniobacteraceae bacterium]
MNTPLSPMRPLPPLARHKKASAIVLTLAVLVLITVLSVGLFSVLMPERISANSNAEAVRARAFTQLAADHAAALIRDATATGTNHTFWASQPGRITVFNADGSTSKTYDLHSGTTASTSGSDGADLNPPSFGGSYPIASSASVASGSAPAMRVAWINVLKDGSVKDAGHAVSSTNPIMGRYAFWVDDESTKLNVNASDGTVKGGTASFGPGTPTEMALQALKTGGVNISITTGSALAVQTGMRPVSGTTPRLFNDPSEILQVTGSGAYFSDNNFSITTRNRSPELNLFGEPKIYLLTTSTDTTPLNLMLGGTYNGTIPLNGGPLAQIYPTSTRISSTYPYGQLPSFAYTAKSGNSNSVSITTGLPQAFMTDVSEVCAASTYASVRYANTTMLTASNSNYAMGMRISKYLSGTNSQGNAITWPTFPGSDSQGFAGKYTNRQIDSISLQLLDLMQKGVFCDHYRTHSQQAIAANGFISNQLTIGQSNMPRINEISVTFETVAGSPPSLKMTICVEWYLPSQCPNYDNSVISQWTWGVSGNTATWLNWQDAPAVTGGAAISGAQGYLGGFWQNNMLRITDQNGDSAGVDLFGNDPALPDPDQASAKLYHASRLRASGTYAGKYMGSGPVSGRVAPALSMSTFILSGKGWAPGEYHCARSSYYGYAYPMKPGVTSITVSGGLAIWSHSESGNTPIDVTPLDSLHGPVYLQDANVDSSGLITSSKDSSISDMVARIKEAVIPISCTVAVPGKKTVVMQVSDPMVNKFPGDWHSVSSASLGNASSASSFPISYSGADGANTGFQGDPAGFWWPQQSQNIPKSQRFPSSGYLQYIHTGIMPDKATESLSISQQHGTPFRLLNFAPSSSASQKTDGGTSYPDWAMLDLFTVPAALQPVSGSLAPILLTWGGATTGRLNPNSALIPFSNASTAMRTTPLEAAMKGLQTCTSFDASYNSVLSTVDEAALAQAIDKYVAALGRPLKLPGEICNVPEVSALLYNGTDSASGLVYSSRNDLVRQMVGNLSTRSNTFCVWAVGQTLNNTTVLAESRMKYMIERYLDYGVDGIPGNTASPGSDGLVGTPDDVIDTGTNAYNPALTYPLHYKYRILSASPVN